MALTVRLGQATVWLKKLLQIRSCQLDGALLELILVFTPKRLSKTEYTAIFQGFFFPYIQLLFVKHMFSSSPRHVLNNEWWVTFVPLTSSFRSRQKIASVSILNNSPPVILHNKYKIFTYTF